MRKVSKDEFRVELSVPHVADSAPAVASKIGASSEMATAQLDRLMAKIDCDRFYNADEVSKLTGVTRRTIWNQIGMGNIPASKFGRSYLIPGASVVALLDEIRAGLSRINATYKRPHFEGHMNTVVA